MNKLKVRRPNRKILNSFFSVSLHVCDVKLKILSFIIYKILARKIINFFHIIHPNIYVYIYMEDKNINGLIIVEKKRIFNSTVIQRNCVFTHIEDQ